MSWNCLAALRSSRSRLFSHERHEIGCGDPPHDEIIDFQVLQMAFTFDLLKVVLAPPGRRCRRSKAVPWPLSGDGCGPWLSAAAFRRGGVQLCGDRALKIASDVNLMSHEEYHKVSRGCGVKI